MNLDLSNSTMIWAIGLAVFGLSAIAFAIIPPQGAGTTLLIEAVVILAIIVLFLVKNMPSTPGGEDGRELSQEKSQESQ